MATKQPILLLASCLSDGTDYIDWELAPDDESARLRLIHKMLLNKENESRKAWNDEYPGDAKPLVDAKNSPLGCGTNMWGLKGEGEDEEGLRVFLVPPALPS